MKIYETFVHHALCMISKTVYVVKIRNISNEMVNAALSSTDPVKKGTSH